MRALAWQDWCVAHECVCCVSHADGADQLGPLRHINGHIVHLRNDYDKDARHVDDETGVTSTLTNEAWLHQQYEGKVRGNHIKRD